MANQYDKTCDLKTSEQNLQKIREILTSLKPKLDRFVDKILEISEEKLLDDRKGFPDRHTKQMQAFDAMEIYYERHWMVHNKEWSPLTGCKNRNFTCREIANKIEHKSFMREMFECLKVFDGYSFEQMYQRYLEWTKRFGAVIFQHNRTEFVLIQTGTMGIYFEGSAKDKEYFAIEPESNSWALPAGKRYFEGETETACARRSVFEETHLDIPLSKFNVNNYIQITSNGTRVKYFLIDECGSDLATDYPPTHNSTEIDHTDQLQDVYFPGRQVCVARWQSVRACVSDQKHCGGSLKDVMGQEKFVSFVQEKAVKKEPQHTYVVSPHHFPKNTTLKLDRKERYEPPAPVEIRRDNYISLQGRSRGQIEYQQLSNPSLKSVTRDGPKRPILRDGTENAKFWITPIEHPSTPKEKLTIQYYPVYDRNLSVIRMQKNPWYPKNK